MVSDGMKRYKFGMRDRSKWRSLLLFSVIIIVILAITGFLGIRRIYINNLQAVDTSATTDIIYVVESGATPPQIAKGLREKALIRSTAAFEQYVRTNELGQEFKAGTYLLKQSQDVANQQRMAGEVDRYKALILNAIRDRWILPENVDPGLSSQFVIRLAPTGSVLDVRLARSSGDSLLDRSAQAAIYKASPLPVPTDVATFNMFREISLTVRPSNARG